MSREVMEYNELRIPEELDFGLVFPGLWEI